MNKLRLKNNSASNISTPVKSQAKTSSNQVQKETNQPKQFTINSENVYHQSQDCIKLSLSILSFWKQLLHQEMKKREIKNTQTSQTSRSSQMDSNVNISQKEEEEEKKKKIKEKEKEKQNEQEKKIEREKEKKKKEKIVEDEVIQFCKHLIQFISEEVVKQKQYFLNQKINKFKTYCKRQKIQAQVDKEIFFAETPKERILYYLKEPHYFIQKKYEEYYQSFWRDLCQQYFKEIIKQNVLQQFYIILEVLREALGDQEREKQPIYSLFKATNNKKIQTNPEQFLENSKRVLFEYFIDLVTSERHNFARTCSGVWISPLKKIELKTKIDPTLKKIITRMKDIKSLNMTNPIAFIKKMMESKTKKKMDEQMKTYLCFLQQDKNFCFKKIKATICKEKCPGCGRICGMENKHDRHKCLYGHQVRGLNGNYFERDNHKKELVNFRCGQMVDSDLVKYKGKQYTWLQFKYYCLHQTKWIFDDCVNDQLTDSFFQDAWKIAATLKYEICQVSNEEIDSKVSAKKIEYLFVVDIGIAWISQEYLNQFVKKTMLTFRQNNEGNNNTMNISILKFQKEYSHYFNTWKGDKINFSQPIIRQNNSIFKTIVQITKQLIKESVLTIVFITNQAVQNSINNNYLKVLKKYKLDNPENLHFLGVQIEKQQKGMYSITSELKGESKIASNMEQITNIILKSLEGSKHIEFIPNY